MDNLLQFPKPEIRGEGAVTYRCAECGEMIEGEATFSDGQFRYPGFWPLLLNEKVRTFHDQHAPEGAINGG